MMPWEIYITVNNMAVTVYTLLIRFTDHDVHMPPYYVPFITVARDFVTTKAISSPYFSCFLGEETQAMGLRWGEISVI